MKMSNSRTLLVLDVKFNRGGRGHQFHVKNTHPVVGYRKANENTAVVAIPQ